MKISRLIIPIFRMKAHCIFYQNYIRAVSTDSMNNSFEFYKNIQQKQAYFDKILQNLRIKHDMKNVFF